MAIVATPSAETSDEEDFDPVLEPKLLPETVRDLIESDSVNGKYVQDRLDVSRTKSKSISIIKVRLNSATCRRFKKLLSSQRKAYLGTYYEVGVLVRQQLDQLTKATTDFYGRRIFSHLAKAADIDATTLRNCLRIVDQWGEAEFSAIIENPRINWGHVIELLSLNTAKERAEFTGKV